VKNFDVSRVNRFIDDNQQFDVRLIYGRTILDGEGEVIARVLCRASHRIRSFAIDPAIRFATAIGARLIGELARNCVSVTVHIGCAETQHYDEFIKGAQPTHLELHGWNNTGIDAILNAAAPSVESIHITIRHRFASAEKFPLLKSAMLAVCANTMQWIHSVAADTLQQLVLTNGEPHFVFAAMDPPLHLKLLKFISIHSFGPVGCTNISQYLMKAQELEQFYLYYVDEVDGVLNGMRDHPTLKFVLAHDTTWNKSDDFEAFIDAVASAPRLDRVSLHGNVTETSENVTLMQLAKSRSLRSITVDRFAQAPRILSEFLRESPQLEELSVWHPLTSDVAIKIYDVLLACRAIGPVIRGRADLEDQTDALRFVRQTAFVVAGCVALRPDGDHAVMTRTLQFLLKPK